MCLLTSACVSKTFQNRKTVLPTDFETFCALDWQNNGNIITDDMISSLEREKNSRSSYFEILSLLKADTPQRTTVSADIRFSLIEKAFCNMAWELLPSSIPVIAADSRRVENTRLLAEFERCQFLKRANLLTVKEEEEYSLLLAVTTAGVGIDIPEMVQKFDYSTLPERPKAKNLPKWLIWNSSTPLIWAKVLMQLPREAKAVSDIDKENLLLCAADVTGLVVSRMMEEHSILYSITDEPRLKAKKQYENHIANAWLRRFELKKTSEYPKEEQFLQDMYVFFR